MRFSNTRLYLTLALLAGCGDSTSPEQQVRAVIEQMEIAAEARDVGALVEHVSENYRDSQGQGRSELSRAARGYFIANQSIHLLTRVEDIQFPTSEEARLKVRVGMAGREPQAGTLDLSAEVRAFDVVLMREDGEWKVTYADPQAH